MIFKWVQPGIISCYCCVSTYLSVCYPLYYCTNCPIISKQLYDLLICNAFADEAHKEGRNCWQIWYILKNVIFPNLCALDMKLTLQTTML
jgi:hypothetical protein